MEYHPLAPQQDSPSASSSAQVAPAPSPSSSSVAPCPESVLKGSQSYEPRLSGHQEAFSPSSSAFFLSDAQVDTFKKNGTLLVRAKDIWTPSELSLLLKSVDEMKQWPDAPGKYMKYYEDSRKTGEKIMCRIENFCEYSAGLDYFCNGDKLLGATSALLGEEAILYKEKINYKLPGGAGFVCHQDVAAGWWMYGQSIHISVLVCVDPATVANGCLEVCNGKHREGMLCEPWKEITPDTEATMKFEPVETAPGDVIFFDSYVPHRSGPNNTDSWRRVLYSTYAKKSEGDWRRKYYEDKRRSYPPDCEREAGKKYEYKV